MTENETFCQRCTFMLWATTWQNVTLLAADVPLKILIQNNLVLIYEYEPLIINIFIFTWQKPGLRYDRYNHSSELSTDTSLLFRFITFLRKKFRTWKSLQWRNVRNRASWILSHRHCWLTTTMSYCQSIINPGEYSLSWPSQEAPPKRGTFFRFQVYKRLWKSLVQVCERSGKLSVISVCKITQKAG